VNLGEADWRLYIIGKAIFGDYGDLLLEVNMISVDVDAPNNCRRLNLWMSVP